MLAIDPRPGHATSNCAADNIALLERAVSRLPGRYRRRLLVRLDGAGFSHELLEHIAAGSGTRGPDWEFSVGWSCTDKEMDAIERLPKDAWTAGIDQNGDLVADTFVAEVTGLLDLGSWHTKIPDLRIIVRDEPGHPRYRKRATERERQLGRRYQLIANQHEGRQVAWLDARHRSHVHVENGRQTGQGPRPEPVALAALGFCDLRRVPAVARRRHEPAAKGGGVAAASNAGRPADDVWDEYRRRERRGRHPERGTPVATHPKTRLSSVARLLAGGTVVAALVAATLAGFSGTAPAAPEIPQIGPGYSENTAGVTCIQKVLGVDPTPAPYGTFGTLTYEAVKGFQGQHGLPQIGGVGPATGALLIPLAPSGCAAHLPSGPGIEQPPQAADADEQRSYPGCPLLLEGNQNRCVERLQHDLNAVNSSYNLPETGFFGPLTRTAVLDFQGRNKLPADGNVGSETADLLADQATSSVGRYVQLYIGDGA